MGILRRFNLNRMAKKGELQPLVMMLTKEPEAIRCDAASALSLIRDSCNVKIAREALVKALLEDSCLDVRIHAAKSLGKIGDPIAVSPLIDSIRNEALKPFFAPKHTILPTEKQVNQVSGRGEYMRLVKIIPDCLKHFGENAVEPLIRVLNDNSARIRGVALLALKNIGSKKAENHIEKILSDEKEDIIMRAMASVALDRVRKRDYLDHFRTYLKEGSSKFEAVFALQNLKEIEGGDFSSLERIEQGMDTEYFQESIKKFLL